MPMCEPCKMIEIERRDAPGHKQLWKMGPAMMYGGITVQGYVCATCGTEWQHENNPEDPHYGWTIVAAPTLLKVKHPR
jgi:hypothetical protein